MRLVCPNCDAEYEVDASVIPDGGRDVQCSNCGHAWFQLPPEVEAELAAEEALYDAPPPMVPVEVAPEVKEPVAAVANSGLDDQMLAVLKEEAEREAQARKAEAPMMETQTELGLEAPAQGNGIGGAVARRLARMKGIDPDAPVAKANSRREVFPAIEEINSTLRASSEKRDRAASDVSDGLPEGGKSGFRTGFSLMLLLAVLAIAVYVMAPELRQQVPGASGMIDSYVAQVDSARLGLDAMLKSLIQWLKGMA